MNTPDDLHDELTAAELAYLEGRALVDADHPGGARRPRGEAQGESLPLALDAVPGGHDELRALGYTVVRITWADLERPGAVAAKVRAALRDVAA